MSRRYSQGMMGGWEDCSHWRRPADFKPEISGTPAIAELPAPVPLPVAGDAAVLGARLGKLTAVLEPGEAYFLADDWRTEGDWIGRYGNGYAKLCGMTDNGDQDYALLPGYEVVVGIGPHHKADADGAMAYYVHGTSGDQRALYDPSLGSRRQGELNDMTYDLAEYPESYDGPDLWVRVKAPEGVHCLSLYFVNNDAHSSNNGTKYRDYDVQVLPGFADDNVANTSPPLARTRVTDFWGGVYKQFLICGPADYVVRIGRNRSVVTKLQGVFLDPVTPPVAKSESAAGIQCGALPGAGEAELPAIAACGCGDEPVGAIGRRIGAAGSCAVAIAAAHLVLPGGGGGRRASRAAGELAMGDRDMDAGGPDEV